MIKCRKCGKNVQECGGYLERMGPLGIPEDEVEWECRPSCDVELSDLDRLLAAIQGGSEEVS